MNNTSGGIGTRTVVSNYEGIMGILNSIDEPRHNMVDAINKMQQLASYGYTDKWNGADAQGYRQWITGDCAKLMATEKWFNQLCWQLKVRAEKLKRDEEEKAARASQLRNGGNL